MAIIDDLLSKLNNEQIAPVLDTEGAVLVIAGAGSGKTRVLTSRIAYLVLHENVSPANIMAITFTNRAADEMKTRLKRIIGDINEMWVSTIHSMCVKILRRDIDKIGFDKNFTIYDETDRDRVLKRVFDELGLDQNKFLKDVKYWISYSKNECLSPDEFKKENSDLHFVKMIYSAYSLYESYLQHSNALDFDDLLFKTYILFCEHPEVADYYSRKFRYIHIDEFQDTNKVQFAIAQRLSVSNGNIFVVGDDDQSIYSWRGAKIENILSFDEIYKGAKVYKLERNYRSSKKIIELANCIISKNANRRKKTLWTDNGEGAKVETYIANDENEEASYVAIQIKSLMNRNRNLKYSDFAVFMRLNALSRPFEQEFAKYGIPYKVFGGFRFFERKEIKDILAYLKLINNPKDDEQFLRSVATPKRGIGERTLTELKEFAVSNGSSLFEAIDKIDFSTLSGTVKSKLKNFKLMIENFIEYSKDKKVVEIIDFILDKTSFMDQFIEKNEENTARKYNISELKNSAEQFAKDNPETDLSDYLNSITLSSDTDDINSDDCVAVATIHSVKGLEFNYVFTCGLDEGVLPVQRSILDENSMEEERRLMYVAVTRARERLYLTRAYSRYLYGKREDMVASRFLKEAKSILYPNAFTESAYQEQNSYKTKSINNYNYNYKSEYTENGFSDSTGSFAYSSGYAKSFVGGNKPIENKSVNYGGFKPGVKVRHKTFGEGTVIVLKGSSDNLIVDVAFKGVGIKSLAVKFAPLEIIK